MKGDFEMIKHSFDTGIKIYPVADVHFGSILHKKKEWESFVKKIAEEENAYLILDGDLLNNNTRSAVGVPWDDCIRPREAKRMMVDFLAPISEKILGITSGNHETRRDNRDADNDLTYDIACKLNIEDLYRENACFLLVNCGKKKHGARWAETPAASYVFCVTHGSGGGVLGGGTLNKNERFGTAAMDGVDCLIVAHTHKGQISRPAKLTVDRQNLQIKVREMLIVSCVSWMNYGGYALRNMYAPNTTGEPQSLILSDKERKISVLW